MNATEVVYIPLKKLKLSALNVRQTENDVSDLVASIRENGLKQNLLVHKVGRGYEVHAGGRRLRALNIVFPDGDYNTPCVVETKEQAEETSLVENFHRLKMHPIDEFVAFDRLLKNGHSLETVANRFGVTTRFVEGRMRLARLSPKILESFRADEIDLDTVKAYTLTDDHARQEEVFEREGAYGSVWSIKSALTKTKINGSSPIVRFIGLEAYEAAGGAITRDLFSNDDSVMIDDPALAERLAMEKLQAKAEELKTEWKWAEVMLSIAYDTFREYGRVYPETSLPADLAAEQETIEARLEEMDEIDENNWTEDLDQELSNLKKRESEIEAQETTAYSAEQMALAGVIVSMDSAGGFRIESGLVHPDDKPKPEPTSSRSTASPTSDPADAARHDAGETISVIEDIRAIRHQILRAHLSADFNTAFDAILYSMAVGIFGYSTYSSQPLNVSIKAAEVYRSKEKLTGTIAESMLQGLKDKLSLEWLNLDQPHDFNAMSALSPREKQDLFAFCVAQGVNQSLSTDPHANPVLEVMGKRMDVDVASCWRPTAEHYWNRVKKGYALKVASEQIAPNWADDHSKDKKAQIAEAMDSAFSDDPQKTAGLNEETAARTSTWLPEGMAYTGEYIEKKKSRTYGYQDDNGNTDIDDDADIEDGENDEEFDDDISSDIAEDIGDDEIETDDDDDSDIPAFLKEAAE